MEGILIVSCSLCKQPLLRGSDALNENPEMFYHGDDTSAEKNCPNVGKKVEFPTIELKEVK